MKKRVLSGARPTGKMHWGNYFGAVKNWVELQEQYDCYYFIADWHALTTNYDRVGEIKPSVIDMVADWLAVGLDSKKSTIFLQSWVPEHCELFMLLSMLTPLGWLERVPSFKDMKQELSDRDLNMLGFLGYPLLQAADIIIHKADFVPVGDDQLAHLEFARELVRRFLFITKKDIFKEPKPLLTNQPRIPGLDGRKMSKSFDNAIYISDSDDVISKKMMSAITDPARKFKTDAGHPDICNIFSYWKLYDSREKCDQVSNDCKNAKIGCVECKKECIKRATAFWKPVREKRDELFKDEDHIFEILRHGSKKAASSASEIMEKVRDAFGVAYDK